MLCEGYLYTLLLQSGIVCGFPAYSAGLALHATVIQCVAPYVLRPLNRAKKCLKPHI